MYSPTANAIAMGLTAAIVPLVLKLLSRATSAEQRTKGVLMYPHLHRGFAVVLCVAPSIVFELIALQRGARDSGELMLWIGLVLFFPLLGLPLILEFFRVSYTFDEEGIRVRSPWSKSRSIVWRDVDKLTWRQTAKWLDISAGNKVLHLSPWLTGLDDFAAMCVAKVDGEVHRANPDVVAVLQLMAAGRAGELIWAPVPPSQLVGLK